MTKTLPEIIAGCERFLSGHARRSAADVAREIAESPWAQERNDVYGKGGIVAMLESEVASMLGKEAAVFMPSGTMAQQIALRIWCDDANSNRVAFHPTCHLELWEQDAYHELHRLQAQLIGRRDRLIELDDLPRDVAAVLLELPQREIGGRLPTWEALVEQCETAHRNGIRLHLDGARLWECQPYYKRSYAEIAALFDSVYVSFYKTIGALPGAMLAGPADFIESARIWQRRHGGNLYNQTMNAISAKICLDRRLPRIAEYVAKAAEVATLLREFPRITVAPESPPTNMMHLYFEGDREALTRAVLTIAEEDRVGLFFTVGDAGKVESSIGDSALDLPTDEVRHLFTKLFALA